MRWIADSSALLARLLGEPVSDAIDRAVDEGMFMSASNHAEVISKLIRLGADPDSLDDLAERSNVNVIPLTQELAAMAGELEPIGRPLGLSLADRCCLATAAAFDAAVLTTDRAWLKLPSPYRERVVCVRPD